MQFTKEELKNIQALISVAPIKGIDAVPVAVLQEKIASILSKEEEGQESK